MEQVIICAPSASPATNATNYCALFGGADVNYVTIEGRVQAALRNAGTFKGFRVEASGDPGAAPNTWLVGLRVGGSTRISVTYSEGESGVKTSATEYTASAGDGVDIITTPTSNPTSARFTISLIFDSTSSTTISCYGGATGNTSATTTTSYVPAFSCAAPDATQNDVAMIIPCAGTLDNLRLDCSTAPGGSETRSLTLQLDTGSGFSDTSVVATATGTGTNGTSGANTQAVSAGDRVVLKNTASASAANSIIRWGIRFTADTAGDFILAHTSDTALSTSADRYEIIHAGDGLPNATEASIDAVACSMTIKNIYAKVASAPGDGKSLTFNLRQDVSSPGLSCQISGASSTQANASGSISIADDDMLATLITPAGTPTVSSHQVSYRATRAAGAQSTERTETATLTDVLAKATTPSAKTETGTLTDTLVKDTGTTRPETSTLTDTIVRDTTPAAKTETQTLTDTLIKDTSTPRTETSTLADTLEKATSTPKTESVSLTDTATKGVGISLEELRT